VRQCTPQFKGTKVEVEYTDSDVKDIRLLFKDIREEDMWREEQSVKKEMNVHGQRWGTIFGNYFSDSEAARPLVEAILQAIEQSHPAVVADLGGGTGFILKELLKRHSLPGVRLVNVDVSPSQLSECKDSRIVLLQTSVAKITRQELQAGANSSLLLIARAIIHYFSQSDQRLLLRHLRSQQKNGEIFVHLSSCFQNKRDAECMNLLYELMGTQKWFGSRAEMEAVLKEEGWSLCQVLPAPSARMDSRDLAERYNLQPQQIISIRKEVAREYGQKPEVFSFTDEGFNAWLQTYIFTCKAI
jgi:trans-aconitate methyltransferase